MANQIELYKNGIFQKDIMNLCDEIYESNFNLCLKAKTNEVLSTIIEHLKKVIFVRYTDDQNNSLVYFINNCETKVDDSLTVKIQNFFLDSIDNDQFSNNVDIINNIEYYSKSKGWSKLETTKIEYYLGYLILYFSDDVFTQYFEKSGDNVFEKHLSSHFSNKVVSKNSFKPDVFPEDTIIWKFNLKNENFFTLNKNDIKLFSCSDFPIYEKYPLYINANTKIEEIIGNIGLNEYYNEDSKYSNELCILSNSNMIDNVTFCVNNINLHYDILESNIFFIEVGNFSVAELISNLLKSDQIFYVYDNICKHVVILENIEKESIKISVYSDNWIITGIFK